MTDAGVEEMVRLVELNLRPLYEQTIGWDHAGKLAELRQPKMRFLTAYDGDGADDLQAFAAYTIEENAPELSGQRIAYLYELQVHPSWQKQGLGTALMSQLVAMAHQEGCQRIFLTCFKDNSRALHFYQGRFAFSVDAFSPDNADYVILSHCCSSDDCRLPPR
jgi:ribosomal protein S18 acetylase RimI-like enzyme